MDRKTDDERWATWMVQARRFAKRENFIDAVARMKLVRQEVRAAIAATADPTEHERLERQLARAEQELAHMESQYRSWRSKIAARRQATIAHAADEMARPLPVPTD